jgi:hypothetical protein
MNFEFSHLIPTDFSPNSRVWIYQSNRLFTLNEALDMEDLLHQFINQWKSHGAPVKGYANLLFGQFVVIIADESSTTVGGCSTDSSVHLIKQLEQLFKVDLFNRQSLAFAIKGKVEILPVQQLNYALQNGFINNQTLYFNNLVATKTELLENWLIPVEESWLKNKIKATS